MASKTKRTSQAAAAALPPVDRKTRSLIIELADEVAAAADKRPRESARWDAATAQLVLPPRTALAYVID